MIADLDLPCQGSQQNLVLSFILIKNLKKGEKNSFKRSLFTRNERFDR